MTMDDYGLPWCYVITAWIGGGGGLFYKWKNIDTQLHLETQTFWNKCFPATHVIKGDIGNGVHNHLISSKRRTEVISHFSTPHAENDKIHTMVIGTRAEAGSTSSHSPAGQWRSVWISGSDLCSRSDRGTLVHVLVSICMCPCACDKERIASQKVWGRGFHQQCSHQHQYASNLKQPSADVTGDLYGIRPATSVTDQPGKKHGCTSLVGGHQHRPTPALIVQQEDKSGESRTGGL